MSTTKGRGDINTTGDDIVLKSGETDQVTISAGDNASAATHKTPDNSSVLVGAEHGGDATKKVAIDSSGATTGTKTTLVASQTADRTVYLPNATTTLATTDLAQTITNKTIDADDNVISNLAHGAEVDNPSSGVHGVTGSVAGTSDAQTFTNKTIDADNNTISNLAHGAEVDNPSSGVHGVSGSVVGTTDTQALSNKSLQDSTTSIVDNADATKVFKFEVSGITTATTRTATVPDADFTMAGTATTQTFTNKTIDGDNNTISNLAHGAEVDNPSSGVHGVTGSVVGTTDTQTLSSKTLTSPVLNGSLSGTAFLDEDNMVSDSAVAAASQQSIKAYVDTEIAAATGGGVSYSAKVADYTVLDGDGIRVIGMTTGVTDRVVTLPTAADNTNRILTVIKVDSGAGTVTLDGEGSETIGSSLTLLLSKQYQKAEIVCDGTGWQVMYASPNGQLIVRGASGHGSTNTAIRNLNTTASVDIGDAFTYAQSAANGSSFTANRACLVGYVYRDRRTTANAHEFGVSLNGTALTTTISSINSSERVGMTQEAGTQDFSEVSGTIYLDSGDILRPHTDGALDETTAVVEFRLTELERFGN